MVVELDVRDGEHWPRAVGISVSRSMHMASTHEAVTNNI